MEGKEVLAIKSNAKLQMGCQPLSKFVFHE
jgi:hypothetical protein